MANHQINSELLQHIFESTSQAILAMDDNMFITKVNPAAQKLFGYYEKELEDKSISAIIPELSKKLNSETDDHITGILVTKKDGTHSLVNIELKSINNKQAFDTVLFIQDDTALKNKQKALVESNRKHQTLINNVNGIVYSCENNLEYKTNLINDGCYSITGYTRDEFLKGSVHFGDIILDEDRIYVWNEVQRALSKRKHFDIHYRIECKNGSIKYVREIGCGVYHNGNTNVTLEGFITDETEQKKTQALLEIRNRALEAAGSGIIIADAQKPNLPIIYCNQSFTKITGYEEAEALGRNCQFLQSNDRDQPQIKTMSIALQKAEPCRVVIRNYRKDGVQFWNDLTITPVKNESGKTTHFIGVQNDVTKQKNAEILKDSTRDILALITESAELSIIGDKIIETIETQIPECRASISLLNSKLNKLERLSESKVISPLLKKINESGSSELLLLHPAFGSIKEIIITNVTNDRNWKEHQSLIQETGIKSCWTFPILSSQKSLLGLLCIYNTNEKKISKKFKETLGGLAKLLKVAIEKYHNSAILKEKEKQLETYTLNLEEKVKERTSEVAATIEKLVGTNLNLEDQIKETQAAEKTAIASKYLSTAIAKNFPNGFIIVFDANFKMIVKEGEAIDELDLDKDIFEGMFIDDIAIFSELQKTKLKEDVLQTMKGEHLNFEMAFKNKYFLVNTTPLVDENNTVSNALFVYNNISQQKRVAQNIQESLKKEQELNELKSRFISMASHEFRTPLSAIQTSAILIGKQNAPGKEEKREKYIGQIKKNVRHLVVILNDFLSLGKLEEGKVTVNREVFDLVVFSKALIEEVSITTKNGQNIQFSASKKTHSLFLDPKLMRHILMNLFSNAIKYSPENTTISFNIDEDEQHLIMTVSDQGIGIKEEEQKNLFERFYRAKNAYDIEGTGLGLSIAKQYVALMGGSIDFKSEPNKGTTFWVKWPKPNKE